MTLLWVCMVLMAAPTLCVAETWVDDSFADFADGTFSGSGQNLYAAHDGSVRTIHRFDINHDGWIDLLLNCTHDLIGILPSTAAWLNADGTATSVPLAVEGASAVATGDLNQDGYTDLVFCPNRNGIQSDRRFVQMIYGGADGWPASRSNGILPVSNAAAVAVGTRSAGYRPEIAVLNGTAWLPKQGEGQIVRVYWQDEHGYLLNNFQDYPMANAIDIGMGDVDNNGGVDLVVLRSDRTITIVWSFGSSTQGSTVTLPGDGAQCLAIADCDADGTLECIVGTNTGTVFITEASYHHQ
ncbi:MAG: VCBS repeat-containing protein, partial [Candidatus Hydrogenedentes bacterium]|nr:VCBS repeat-containing protein [Candidatus Hydrogenedentota bacterium]